VKTYRGQRYKFDAWITVSEPGHRTRLLKQRGHHSPTGFEWGYGGSGPADLARSLLHDATGEQPSETLYQAFKWGMITSLQHETWTLTQDQILWWVRSWNREHP